MAMHATTYRVCGVVTVLLVLLDRLMLVEQLLSMYA